MSMRDRVEDLKKRRQKNLEMGGEERIARQNQKGKLDVRTRLGLLFDPGTFVELGLLANRAGYMDDPSAPAPADGVITGTGLIDGRPVACAAYDFTIFGG